MSLGSSSSCQRLDKNPRKQTFGLELENVWRSVDNPKEVFFMISMETREAAERFMADPASAAVGERAGAVDADVWFLE